MMGGAQLARLRQSSHACRQWRAAHQEDGRMNTPHTRRSRRAFTLALWTMAAVCLAGCHSYGYAGGDYGFGVGTYYGPYWYPANYGTFTVVRYPWWGDPPPPPANDP